MSKYLLRKRLVVLAVVLVGLVVLAAGTLLWQVERAVHPTRKVEAVGETVTALVRYEEVRFESADGVPLAGWLFRNRPGAAVVVLCHDAGGGKSALMNIAAPLQTAGFIVLALDFRGHGESRGEGTTFGIAESRDILGAVRYLAEGDDEGRTPAKEVGVYGIGMGAHAAILAAREDTRIRVLVLDGPYSDAGWRLRREIFGSWEFGARWLSTPCEVAFNLLRRTHIKRYRAADVLPALTGRDILLIAPAGDQELAEEVRSLYTSIPEQRNTDGNLVTLPSAGTGALFGENIQIYQQRVVSFLDGRLNQE
jgi:pimeloyl-ACP methyl ester carboxylesterase